MYKVQGMVLSLTERRSKKLQKEYIQNTQSSSAIYAHMGALGISPEHMLAYTESVTKLKKEGTH